MTALVRHLATAILAFVAVGCSMPSERPGRGDKLLDVALYTLDGRKTSLLEMARGRVAVFEFGATWCVPCTKQIAHLNEIAARYPKGSVSVFGIDLREDPRTVQAHLQRHGATYPVLLDPRGAAAALYSVSAIPVTIIAGPDHTIVYRSSAATVSQMERAIDALLAARTSAPGN
ncbi:MAG TPA: TlpA disulfide reductase family protein [Planctomycetota bacterium]|nr:TlpA disulfide reductase family protein [Planctomycetota bacterium]HRR81639.1 TlpA disulfide reductase family protein [Planctomycetota bacterium]HRT93689.1 TlpA disulfide reductase family protein [Planctomycetota bacterium]